MPLGMLSSFIQLLLFPLIVSVAIALVRVTIGFLTECFVQVIFGSAHLLVIVPLAITFHARGYPIAVIAGELLLGLLVIALVIEWIVLRHTPEILLGIIGVLAFAGHVFLLANAP